MDVSYMTDVAELRDQLGHLGEDAQRSNAASADLRAQRDQLIVELYRTGMTQMEIARIAGVDQSVVSRRVCRDRRSRIAAAMELVPPDAPPTVQDGTTKGEMR